MSAKSLKIIASRCFLLTKYRVIHLMFLPYGKGERTPDFQHVCRVTEENYPTKRDWQSASMRKFFDYQKIKLEGNICRVCLKRKEEIDADLGKFTS